MSIRPITAENGAPNPRRLKQPPPLRLDAVALNCPRDELHLDRITNNDMLMAIWPWMRDGLAYIKAKNSPSSHWLPEHVRAQIQQGLAQPSLNSTECFVGHDADTNELRGFLVCHGLLDPFTQLFLVWHVWMGNIMERHFEKVLPEFLALGRARGYREYQFTTRRKAWVARARRFGMQPTEYTIRGSVEDEPNGLS